MLASSQLIGFAAGGGMPAVTLTVSSSTADYNAYNAFVALYGTPSGPYAVTLNVNAACYASSAASFGVDQGSWPAGSTFKIVNTSYIDGHAGAGSTGPGTAGGAALNLTCPTTVDNTSGCIRGGGGGGGGGQSVYWEDTYYSGTYSFSVPGGSGGVGQDDYGGPAAGSVGGYGTDTYDGLTYAYGGTGGTGGAWGQPGGSGGNGTYGSSSPIGFTVTTYGPYGGGAAGNAVHSNGYSLAWLGGNNGTQVLGGIT